MFSFIILASGKSERMGRDKAFLPFDVNHSFLQHILTVYQSFKGNKGVVVANKSNYTAIESQLKDFSQSIKLVENSNPDLGRLHSIRLGLKKVNTEENVFIQNVDNPFVSKDILQQMLQDCKPNVFIVPRCKDKNGHPILLGSEIVANLKRSDVDDFKSFLNTQNKISIAVTNQSIHANINTPMDYEKWFSSK
ncbi:MAG: nucleotidyltransferase family protein [Bacteroidales bacterium]|nr:nucleotidyltransferase family protein [Bacteroidales bacterium]